MSWLQLVLRVKREQAALIEAALEGVGALSVTFTDDGDEPQFEPPPGTTPLWRQLRLTALFPNEVQSREQIERLTRTIAEGLTAPPRLEELEDRAWERVWLEAFAPTRFGHRLWVCPREQAPPPGSNVVVALDPGLAFGTGHHPTTALCLRWLDGATLDGLRVLDYGCGSGILAIAALRLGASSAVAVDHDPQALEATSANARENGVDGRLRVCTPEALPTLEADLVLANILAGPLVGLAPHLSALTRSGGRLILSGLLADQTTQVRAAYASWFEFAPPQIEQDWVLLSAQRRTDR
jgi:ribosomal protein L11 methyltransferase